MSDISHINIFVVESEEVKKFRRSFTKDEKPSSRQFLELPLESSAIAKRGKIPYTKVQVTPETTILDVIRSIKANPFFTKHYIEWIIQYAYVIDRPQISIFTGFDIEKESLKESKKRAEGVIAQSKLEKYYKRPIIDLKIVDNDVLLLKPIEISRKSTGAIVRYMMCSTPTVIDFLDMVNNSISGSHAHLNMALLYTDSDQDIAKFVRESYNDLHTLSGPNLNIYAVEKVCNSTTIQEAISYWRYILSDRLYVVWSGLGWLTRKPYDKTQCYEIGEILGIRPDQFPCIALFDDLKPGRVLIFPISKPYIKFFRSLFVELNKIVKPLATSMAIKDMLEYEDKNIFESVQMQFERLKEEILSSTRIETHEAVEKYVFNGKTVFVNKPRGKIKFDNFQKEEK